MVWILLIVLSNVLQIYGKLQTNEIQHTQSFDFIPPTTVSWTDENTNSSSVDDACLLTSLVEVSKVVSNAWHRRGLQLIADGKGDTQNVAFYFYHRHELRGTTATVDVAIWNNSSLARCS